MIDAHCHLNASHTAENVSAVIARFLAMKGQRIIDVTTDIKDFAVSQEIVKQNPEIVFSTVGFHPESPDGTDETFVEIENGLNQLANLISKAKNIVGIGETGLDYSFFEKFPTNHKLVLDQQHELLTRHIAIAKRERLPLVIHARGKHLLDYSPYTEILSVLQQENFSHSVYLHSFAGDYVLAKKMVDLGYYLGVNGIVTYSNATAIAEVAGKIPSTNLVLETDSPFLIPSNLDRTLLGNAKVNEPIGIFSIAKRVATLRKVAIEEVLENASTASKMLFAKML